MKILFVDDIRLPSFVGYFEDEHDIDVAEDFEEAVRFLIENRYDVISLDHDLGSELTGMDILKWMADNDIWPEWVRVHSANPPAAQRMIDFIEDYERSHG